jgi:glutathione S-transferase
MSLTLHYHPLSSFCHKVLIALYEQGVTFTPKLVNLGDPDERASHLAMWPVGKIPVLRDERLNRTIPETTIIIEYVDQQYANLTRLFPSDSDRALEARLWDRFFDLYVSVPVQKIVIDRLRGAGAQDAAGVADARATLATAYDMLERQLTHRTWAIGESFTVADCAAAPALFYSNTLHSFEQSHPKLAAYFERLVARPSVHRTFVEARPYFQNYPYREQIPARFLSGG